MQRELIERIRALMDEGVGTRVLGWRKGESFYDTEPALLAADQLDELVYDSFCGPNLSKYLIQEMPKLAEGEKVIALIKPCDSYSFNQLCTEHRIDRDRVYVIGVGCRGKVDIEKIRNKGIAGITSVDEDGDTLTVKQIVDRLTERLFCFESADILDESTVRKKLKEYLKKEGFVL